MRRLMMAAAAAALALGGCAEGPGEAFLGSGTIDATVVRVGAEVGGEILAMKVREGMPVAAGDTVAVIDVGQIERERVATAAGLEEIAAQRAVADNELAAAREQVEQARITLEDAERTLGRIAALVSENAATEEQLDRAQTAFDLAGSQVRSAELRVQSTRRNLALLDARRESLLKQVDVLDYRLSQAVVTSPLKGTVVDRIHEQGEVVAPGTPLCTVADLENVWLTIYVDEPTLGSLRIGQDIAVTTDSDTGQEYIGHISWISPEAEFTPRNVQTRQSRAELVYEVRISLDNPEGVFKIGMPAEASFPGGPAK